MGLGDLSDTSRSLDSLWGRASSRPVVAGVFGITVLAVLARLVFLGDRIAHFDEARVGYWAIHYLDTGEFHYRFIIHGPFVQHVSAWLFAAVEPSDFTMRLPVAIIGALLPASVLLYRPHLRDSEVVAAAIFLAFNPLLLYYSRFYRSTVPAIAFAFVAVGLFVRAIDTRKLRYVHVAVAFVALSFTAKENAIVYVLAWLGASVLLLDHVLFRNHDVRSGLDVLREFWVEDVRPNLERRFLARSAGHLGLAALIFAAVILYFYAPRAGHTGSIGLWKALGDPTRFPALIDVTLYGSDTYPRQPGMIEGYQYWLGGGVESGGAHATILDRYLKFGGVALKALAEYATPLVVFGIAGFVWERYGRARSRFVVFFAFYWGFVSLLGFPLGSDIASAWINVNGLVPLSIPAGVGLAGVYRAGRSGWTARDPSTTVIAVVVFGLVVLSMGYGTATGVYSNAQSEDNSLVQYAQPADDLRPALTDMREAANANDGTDVLFVGDRVVAGDKPDTVNTVYPACSRMIKTLPMHWYIAITDATADCVIDQNFSTIDRADPPPVVITRAPYDQGLQDIVGDYVIREYYFRALGGKTSIMIDPAYVAENGSTRNLDREP